MDETEARAALADAAARHTALLDSKRCLYEVILQIGKTLPQREIAEATGWTREQIRQIQIGRRRQ